MRTSVLLGVIAALGAGAADAQVAPGSPSGATSSNGVLPDAALPPGAVVREGGSSENERDSLEGTIDAANYLMGPGDKLVVSVWGLREANTEVEVNAEGRLVVPRVGVFEVRGRNLAAVRNDVLKKQHAVYPKLNCAITLVRPRSFRVHVTGAVMRPGAYTATPLTRVSALVARAGGQLPQGSLRRVEVRRETLGGGAPKTITADLLRLTLLGQNDRDPTVLDGDVVFVPLRNLEVEVSGAVKRPGRYELVEGRDVSELLELAGGLAADVARDLPMRVDGRGEHDRIAVKSVNLDEAKTVPLADGDRVHVPGIVDLRRTVVVEGAVVGVPETQGQMQLQRNPTTQDRHADSTVSTPRDLSLTLPFVDGDGVRDLLNKVGGVQPWADLEAAYLLRKKPEKQGVNRQRISLDLRGIFSRSVPDPELHEGDTLVVPSRRESILVSGAVQRPGLYQYSPDLKPIDYVMIAGGASRTGNIKGAKVVSHDGGTQELSKVSAIEPGDSIAVPERRFTTSEVVEVVLILTNLAVGITALTLTQLN